MGVVDLCVGVPGSTAPPTSGVAFDFTAPSTSFARVGSCNPSSIIGLLRSVGFGVAASPNRGKG